MRNILLIVLVGLGFLLLFSLALAQEALPNAPVPSPSPVVYPLPYPGILPDHPLYVFKQIRDQILLLLITNPVRRIEFHILLADKHLNMGIFLVEKGKSKLAVTTISRGVAYLGKAEVYLFQIPGGGTPEMLSLKDRFEQSLGKHQEIVDALITQLTGSENTALLSISANLTTLRQDFIGKK